MAFFDSPKNRALWEREMTGLRAEKQRRAEQGYEPQAKTQEKQAAAADTFGRRRINLAELERIELESSGIRRVRRPTKERPLVRGNEKNKQMEQPKLSARTR